MTILIKHVLSMEDSHTIKLKQYIEIDLDAKPLSIDEILGKYPF